MKTSAIAALVLSGVALSGCATMIDGTTQSIAVRTTPVAGANCLLSNGHGAWAVITPASVTVHKDKHSLIVVCKKDGYQDATAILRSHFNGDTILGGAPGVLIDVQNGAGFTYPNAADVAMVPGAGTPPPVAVAPITSPSETPAK
ncbi:MAG TPA: hypothetical protein VHU87_03110 [Rhizomicrobium sp.]|jgi:hypothetical protein|nr:hypothetical protein [Rhizomicrobium sp.]